MTSSSPDAWLRDGASACDRGPYVPPAHVLVGRQPGERENRRRDVVDREVFPPPRGEPRTRHHADALAVVVRVVGSRVVVEGPMPAVAETAVAAPAEVTEVDDEVRRDAPSLTPELFGPEDPRSDRPPVGTRQPLEPLGELVAQEGV